MLAREVLCVKAVGRDVIGNEVILAVKITRP